ncbi:right-handed parallel beta-helix repeat-containing protein [Flavobacteriaceae bacterium SZ-1-7]|uniref:right-handed parallel beta-helix repeat-containing protein n=1 Tax=Tamlana sedimenti TaxID=3134126 RepID=UPI00312B0DC7
MITKSFNFYSNPSIKFISIKNGVLIFVFVMTLSYIHSQTNIPGGLVEGTWTKSNSPYIIEGAILVADTKSLTIEPGVKVEFQGDYKFSVLGQLIAIGTVNDTITFTASNPSLGWLGVRFENTSSTNDTSSFSYCKFEYGKANWPSPLNSGGAFFIEGYSKVNISNSLIENCYAELNGGGIFCDNGSSPNIKNNTIRNNTAKGGGGGIYAGALCSPVIDNNNISSNVALELSGAGIYTYDSGGSGSPIIKNNKISFNICDGGRGGGIRVLSKSASITGNIITYNEASGDIGGGGLYITKVGTGGTGNIVSHNVISNNKTFNDLDEYGGGGIYWSSNGANDLISNNLISNNSTSKDGGGIHFFASSPTMINNTIVNNMARNGGGLFCKNSSDPNISNSIFWGNEASGSRNQIYLEDEGSDPNIYYSDIENGLLGVQSAQNTFYLGEYLNNINLDPLFNNPSSGVGSNFDGFNSDWTLNSSVPSPCINQISPSSNTSQFDLAGNPRVHENFIDMGCYESQEATLGLKRINENTFSIYPVPATDYLRIKGKTQISSLVIYNSKGQIVKSYSKINNQEKIDVSNLESGIYLIRLNNSISYKILKR